MPIIKGCQVLVDEAMSQVTTHSVAEVQASFLGNEQPLADLIFKIITWPLQLGG
jgi:hypothetical protein